MAAPVNTGPAPLGPTGEQEKANILVVDDLAASADTLMTLLEMEGFDVRTANEGATALKIADEFRPEVVLLDIGLPGMNGFEVANRLRGLECDQAQGFLYSKPIPADELARMLPALNRPPAAGPGSELEVVRNLGDAGPGA
jgi:CheY-like chemotaxis protein